MGVTERAIRKWKAAGVAPRAVTLALYWHTHHARYFVVNEARDEIARYYQRAIRAELENDRLRRRIGYLQALQSHGSANDPAFQSA